MSATCKHDGCGQPRYAREYCTAHYHRVRQGKDMDAPIRRAGSDPERFWQKVAKTEGCWEWTAAKDRAGYGTYWVDGSHKYAHRVSYERSVGPIPQGMEVDHTCLNKSCVRPSHLRLATRMLNLQNLSGAYSTSQSGIRGIRQVANGRWVARASAMGEQHHIGTFDTAEDAEAAITAWRQVNMPYSIMDQKRVS